MNNYLLNTLKLGLAVALAAGAGNSARCDDDSTDLTIVKPHGQIGLTKPIPVSLSGFTGEGLSVLKFDLYVQGFSFVAPDAAQYQITGSDAGNISGNVVDKVAGKSVLSRSYSGASLRRQAHFFANDIVQAIQHVPGIGLTKIAYKKELSTGHMEIYVSDFDGNDPQPVTHDNAIVAAPCWVPGHMALYYTSYYPGRMDIFYDNLASGQRAVVAKDSDLNTAPAVSPDGSRLAMVTSRSGSPNIWVTAANGADPKRVSTSEEDSSPCWSPNGDWICFATKIHARRVLAKVPATGGDLQVIHTSGVSSPTEPDWSPDGKWIAFTRQALEFDICVVPVDGSSEPIVLVRGEDPSWSPNSRTLVFVRRGPGGTYALSVLDVMTKQVKDIRRTSGNDSQPAWAR